MSTEGMTLEQLADDIRREHDQVGRCVRDSLAHARAAGEKAIEAKKMVEHGEWLP